MTLGNASPADFESSGIEEVLAERSEAALATPTASGVVRALLTLPLSVWFALQDSFKPRGPLTPPA
jgi:hypothetical protein